MNILITGANGFVGGHLVAHLAQLGAMTLHGVSNSGPLDANPAITMHNCDLRDKDCVRDLLATLRPALIFHLAAQAFVPRSFEEPWETLENNLKAQVLLFEALRALGLAARVLVVGSAEVYGKILPQENPVDESQPFRPANPYSVSKVGQDMLAYQYHLSYGMPILRARPFNHIGPGQNTRFALPNFAAQIAAAEAGAAETVIRVGNLSAERDFTDVRDVVRAYALIALRGSPGEVYNVCSGRAYAIGDLLKTMCDLSTVPLSIEVEEGRLRPVDVPRVVGSYDRLCQATEWHPAIDIRQSLQDILDYAREQRQTQT